MFGVFGVVLVGIGVSVLFYIGLFCVWLDSIFFYLFYCFVIGSVFFMIVVECVKVK